MPAAAAFSSVWSADQWSESLIETLTNNAVLLAGGANRVLVDGRSIHIPRLLTRPGGDWVAENLDLPSDAGDADEIEYTPKKIANLIGLSTESIEDSSVDQLNEVSNAMTLGLAQRVDAKAFSADAAVTTGNKPSPEGLLHPVLPGTSGTVDADTILAAEGAIQGVGGNPSTTFINPTDLTALKLAKDGQQRYLFGATPFVSKFQPTPAIAEGHALIADARYINVAVRRDILAEFDDSFYFGSDQVAVRVTARVDFGWADTNAGYLIVPA